MILGIASADVLLKNAPNNAMSGMTFWGGAGWARIGQYINHYKAAGFDVIVGKLWKESDKGLTIEGEHGARIQPDVVLLQRMMMPNMALAINFAKANGQVVINDVDDWFWGLDTSNQAYIGTHPKTVIKTPRFDGSGQPIKDMFGNQMYDETMNPENINNYAKTIAASSLVTVSTPYLAERLSARVRVPIEVVPNYVDLSRFRPVVQTPGVPTFGWAGSLDHRSGDVEQIAGVLRPSVLDGTIHLHHSGDYRHQRRTDGEMLDRYPTTFAETIGVPDEMVSTLPISPSSEYPKLLTFDVGMVPLRETPFNEAKSDIKGLEYAACGIPFIASASSEYAKLWEDWGGCFHIAKRPKDWISGIKRYTDYRNRLIDGATLLDRVRDRDIRYGASKWIELLQGVA